MPALMFTSKLESDLVVEFRSAKTCLLSNTQSVSGLFVPLFRSKFCRIGVLQTVINVHLAVS
jgi:hypothetical protein